MMSHDDYAIVRGCVRTPSGLLIGSAYQPPPRPQSADADRLQSHLLAKPAPVRSAAHLRLVSDCCTGDCRQGRDCPEATRIDWLDIACWAGGCALLAWVAYTALAAVGAGAF